MVNMLAPRANPFLYGHDAAMTAIEDALHKGRLHHAWLITGPPGIGKATLAFHFARRLLAQSDEDGKAWNLDPTDLVFRRIAAGTHADLLTVEKGYNEKTKRERSEIVVDDVRDIADFMRLTPAEAGWRVVIVDGVENLNRNASNALLKVLEEPPQQAILLMTCAAPGRLLPTIRSRCRTLRLSPLSDVDMQTVLTNMQLKLPPNELNQLITLADGSPGRAWMLVQANGLQIASLVTKTLESLPKPRIYDIIDSLGKIDSGLMDFLTLLRAQLSATLRTNIIETSGTGKKTTPDWLHLHTTDRWAEIWQEITKIQIETTSYNLDERQAVISSLALLAGQTV
jgi:DNA polymerase III subunit delta'